MFLGPSIDFDPSTNSLVVDISKYKDTGAFVGRNDLSKEDLNNYKEEIILNSVNALMKRGINGLYIYAVNENLRNHLLELQARIDSERDF